MRLSRRDFFGVAGTLALGFNGLHLFLERAAKGSHIAAAERYGPLLPDPEGVLSLPRGFSYRIISQTGDLMDDGFRVPGLADGMAAFAGEDGRTLLVRNHEMNLESPPSLGPFGANNELFTRLDPAQVYDAGQGGLPCLGGTTTLVYDSASQRLVSQHLSLTGTLRNCAGGPSPWGSWITCEEAVNRAGRICAQDHGYCFEVPASAEVGLADPVPLRGMGRFNHEAVAVDPASGIVYETEDREDSLIYRFVPNQQERLAEGGRLQALAFAGQSNIDTRNWTEQAVPVGERFAVRWVDIDDVEAPNDDLRYQGFEAGAARFARGEGMWYGNDAVYFACTSGGRLQKGQIWRYTPSPQEGQPGEENEPGYIELFVEPNDGALVENADNLTVAPWGDVVVCEDGTGDNFIVGVTPEGELYRLGHNVLNDSEFAGATFSPDGSTLFVNIQTPGLTIAITGPWLS
jgi:uncharacterized protein